MEKHETYSMFGDFFKQKRMESGLTLRQFCQEKGLDPGNVSRIERGSAAPPQSRDLLEKYAKYLGIERDSDSWYQFFDLAHAVSGRIPDEIMQDEMLVKSLPVVFRTIRGQKIPDEKLDDLIKRIKES